MIPTRRSAAILASDDDARTLLIDILSELGVCPAETGAVDLAVVLLPRGASVRSTLSEILRRVGRAPVLLVLPFADEQLLLEAYQAGASGCFALGRPIDELRAAVAALTQELPT